MRRATKVVAGAAAALTVAAAIALPGAEASGDATVVVHGAALPAGGRSQLNLVGCSSVFGRTTEAIAPMVGIAPDGPSGPDGRRSLAFDLAGGNAVGPVSYVDGVDAITDAGVSVYAPDGTTGVAYVGYQAPEDAGTTLMWIGRADLSAAAGTWTSVDVRGLGYVWTQYDMSTHEQVAEVGASGIPAFVQAMGGDGAGFYAIGFGCDGHAFNTDAWRIGTSDGTTTYDFEGYSTKVSGGQDQTIAPGETLRLGAHVTSGDGAPLGSVRVVLEKKVDDGWAVVQDRTGPDATVPVRPREDTTYRWKVYSTAMVEGAESAPFTVTVQEPDDPTAPPSDDPSTPPADEPSDPPSQEPSAPASSEAPADPAAPAVESTPPADPATPDPTPMTVEQPADAPTDAPADAPASEQPAPPGAAAEAPTG
ncbi:hypothetical protein [Nocardioides hankookensis]|uniref:Uncharacterized protein n=1 Tax=Nocardioides hankookensis TaxID=443157 RepID=A0ABW1LQN3_9ACTN